MGKFLNKVTTLLLALTLVVTSGIFNATQVKAADDRANLVLGQEYTLGGVKWTVVEKFDDYDVLMVSEYIKANPGEFGTDFQLAVKWVDDYCNGDYEKQHSWLLNALINTITEHPGYSPFYISLPLSDGDYSGCNLYERLDTLEEKYRQYINGLKIYNAYIEINDLEATNATFGKGFYLIPSTFIASSEMFDSRTQLSNDYIGIEGKENYYSTIKKIQQEKVEINQKNIEIARNIGFSNSDVIKGSTAGTVLFGDKRSITGKMLKKAGSTNGYTYCITPPCFNLDTSKVTLNGNIIERKPVNKTAENSVASTEYQEYSDNGDCEVYTSIASMFMVTIPKKIVLGGKTKAANYTVNVTGDIAGNELVNVVPDRSFTLTEKGGKADKTAVVTQGKTAFAYDDIYVEGGHTENGSVAAPITAGTWSGTFDFSIYLNDK